MNFIQIIYNPSERYKKKKERTSLRSHVMNSVNDARIRTPRVSQYTLRVQVGSMQSIKTKIKGGILVSKALHRSPLCLCAHTASHCED